MTAFGTWSVRCSSFFLFAVVVSIALVKGLGLLSFGDRWWDITVPIIFLASIVGLVTGIVALRRGDRTWSVKLSVLVGILSILFIFLHSLFISD